MRSDDTPFACSKPLLLGGLFSVNGDAHSRIQYCDLTTKSNSEQTEEGDFDVSFDEDFFQHIYLQSGADASALKETEDD